MNYLYAFGSVLAVSAFSLVGVFFLSLREEKLKRYIFSFLSLATGALLGDAFIHLIPESIEGLGGSTAGALVVFGIIIFFIMEKFLHWHHHGEDKEESHVHPVGKLILVSDGFHNFLDGVIIGVSFMISIPVGIATAVAVILHEIPQEIGDFAVLLHAGYSKIRALWLNLLSGLCSVVGLAFAFALGEYGKNIVSFILPLASGGFIYIAVADLIPELHKTKGVRNLLIQILMIVLGALLMLALTLVE